MTTSDLIASASLFVACLAFLVASYAIARANATTSSATLVALNEGFRQAWKRFGEASTKKKDYELAELLNLLEIACAAYLERSLTGNSRKLAFEYLDGSLNILINDEDARSRSQSLLQSETTFEFIIAFLKKERSSLSVVVPPEWYER